MRVSLQKKQNLDVGKDKGDNGHFRSSLPRRTHDFVGPPVRQINNINLIRTLEISMLPNRRVAVYALQGNIVDTSKGP